MPTSRGRGRRHESSSARRRRRQQQSRGRRRYVDYEMSLPEFVRDFEGLLTDEDRRHMVAAIDASAEGDLEAAWDHHMSAPFVAESAVIQDLAQLRRLGESSASWVWARWISRLAYGWMLQTADPRVDEAAITAVSASHWRDDLDASPEGLDALMTMVAGRDWVARQTALWDLGGLVDFLEVKAGADLLARAPEVVDWPRTRLGGYRLRAAGATGLQAHDLATGECHEVLNLGAGSDGGYDATVIGRLVPAGSDGGLMFEIRPVIAASAVCQDLAEAAGSGKNWAGALLRGREEGRWASRDAWLPWTPLTTDLASLPPLPALDEPAGRTQELMDGGLSRDVAEAVGVCEVALLASAVAPDGLVGCGPHVATVIVEPAVFEAAMEHCTGHDHQSGWERIAASVPEPSRARCLALARACGGPQAA